MRISFRAFEWVVDVVFLITAVALLWSALISHRSGAQNVQPSQPGVSLQIGMLMPTMGGSWTTDRPTLIMFLSDTCHWCTASADFYQELLESNLHGKFRMLALLPQPFDDARNYVHSLGLWIPDSNIKSANLSQLGVQVTPVLVLVDGQRRIQAIWIGKLSPAEEKDVFHDVGVK